MENHELKLFNILLSIAKETNDETLKKQLIIYKQQGKKLPVCKRCLDKLEGVHNGNEQTS